MRFILSLILIITSFSLFAQNTSYLADLAELRNILQKTPSFRDQIKGEKLAAYDELYARLAADTVSDPRDYKYFYNLAQLLFPLRDNHLGFYQLALQDVKIQGSLEEFLQSKSPVQLPRYEIDIDSLKKILLAKPVDSIEGIYHYDKYYSVGVFRINEKELVGVVTDSEIGLWQKGEIAIRLYQSGPNLYKAIYGHPLGKYFIYEGSEKYRNRSLINSKFYSSFSQRVYSKNRQQSDFVNLPAGSARFLMKNINKDVQYLLIRTFQANPRAEKESNRFYDSIKNLVNAPNLILDLRNNEGGAGRLARKFFDLLKDYTEKGKLYILLNNGTLSQAEIFTLNLKRLNNVTTVGQTTKGMLAYGSNYGNRFRLPSKHFEVYPTDMRDGLGLLVYEDRGIDPEIFLNDQSDWIDQLLAIINR